jgi:molybdopterin/thiamine biosynthesis adenylyltransferase
MNAKDPEAPQEGAGRYQQQLRFQPFGAAGHQRLQEACIGIVGLGGLGAALAVHVVRCGAGRVILIDRDFVEDSNLPRQILYTEADANEALPKAVAAERHLRRVDSRSRIEAHVADFSTRNASLLDDCDLVLDGLDNVETRVLINDYCRKAEKPWVYGGAVGAQGVVLLVGPRGPCLRCVFPDLDQATGLETCDTSGVLSPLPALVAALQVCEAMRWFADPQAESRLWHLDPWSGHAFLSSALSTNERCPCCAGGRYPALERPSSTSARLCGRGMIQIAPDLPRSLDLPSLAARWKGLGAVEQNPFLVRLHVEGCTICAFGDGRALIQGVEEVPRARVLYARYVGA